jgi:hypothetical protein
VRLTTRRCGAAATGRGVLSVISKMELRSELGEGKACETRTHDTMERSDDSEPTPS